MSKETQPYTTFMMPARHFDMDRPHFTVTKATDSTEIDRRKSMPSGTIMQEHQNMGAMIQVQILRQPFEDPVDVDYLTNALAPADINTDIYQSAQGTDEVMNRQADMPVAADDRAQWRQSPEGIWHRLQTSLGHTADMASRMLVAHSSEHVPKYLPRRTGRAFGSSALVLTNMPYIRELPQASAFDIQYAIRARSLAMLERSRQLDRAIGEPPSVAALADVDSAYSAWLRRHAPSRHVRNVIEQAQEELGAAA